MMLSGVVLLPPPFHTIADEISRHHLRNLDQHMARLIDEQHKGREQVLRELRSEIRLVTRTIAIAAGQPQAVRD